MFGLFSCVTPSPETVTQESSQDDYEETIVFDSNSSIAGSKSSSSSNMCKLYETGPADTAKESNNAMRSERTSAISLSQQELSRVVVMSFDSYGKLKEETRNEINLRPHHSFDHSETTSVKEQKKQSNDKNTKKKSYLERIKQRRQEQREDVDYNDLDSFSETGSCKILKRLKEENQQKSTRTTTTPSSANSVASSITGSSFGGSIVSNISGSSSMRRRNREALRSKQTQIMSMAELAGFSATTKSKKKKEKSADNNKKSWFKRKVKDSTPKRTNKVADWSVTISAVNSIVDIASVQSKQLSSSNDNLVSILRTNNNNSITPPQSPNVRFAEGTVFQDPHQTRRKKVPRIRGGKTNYQQRKQRAAKKASNTLSVNTDIPFESEETALSVDNDGYCNAMAPLVHAMVKANMGCYVFR